jgi:hypothetical protein
MTIYIDHAPGKGLGVFASKDFKKDEVIEVCPVIIMSHEDSELIISTVLNEYQFQWGKDGKEGAICLGYGSLYNHSHTPNAEFDTDLEKRTITFTALKDIKKGEEICTNYDWELDDPTVPDWFKKSHPKNGHKEN